MICALKRRTRGEKSYPEMIGVVHPLFFGDPFRMRAPPAVPLPWSNTSSLTADGLGLPMDHQAALTGSDTADAPPGDVAPTLCT